MAIEAFWHGPVGSFLAARSGAILDRLAAEAQRRFRRNESAQLRAWTEQCAILNDALTQTPAASSWYILFEVSLPRTNRRADVVLLAGPSVIVMEFKIGATSVDNDARIQAEDFALDLQDFHAGSRGIAILPVVVATEAGDGASGQLPLPLPFVAPVDGGNPEWLRRLLVRLAGESHAPIDPAAWMAAPYRPVPPIIEAARLLYSRHRVDDILDASAGVESLARTSTAIRAALQAAQGAKRHTVLFVTGVPGAGKTLCGLNACFGAAEDDLRATFLTGNPSLVHVLREALVRDAVAQGQNRRVAEQRMQGIIQALPAFRDRYVAHGDAPPEQVVVIDEAQRSWSRAHAVRKSRDRPVRLTDSEPAHLLAAMARHPDWAAVICLVGHGQEIHDGEGGLAEWGTALAQAAAPWRIVAAPDCLEQTEPRRRLPNLPCLGTDHRLHLAVPSRQIGHPTASSWVDAVLSGDSARAAALAAASDAGMPFSLTRDQPTLRTRLRQLARGSRRAGLVCSSGARRLRAVGLGAELDHMDEKAVARWFLDRWPADVRASDALEVVATEFSIQGLELDAVGLCWDADLIRIQGQVTWRARRFAGTDWQVMRDDEKIANQINTYRVLLTRARHHTVIYVPQGDPTDRTRDPAPLDGIAGFLRTCGVEEA
jgi:hypothetical protein